MSVKTRSDEIRDELETNLSIINDKLGVARQQIITMFDPSIWGSEQWSSSFITKCEDYQAEIERFMTLTRRFLRDSQGE